MNRIVVEVGSTVSKVDRCSEGVIERLKDVTIQFKKNYSLTNEIDSNDFDTLVELVNSLKKEYDDIYVCGTSIFRVLPEDQKKNFLEDFKARTGYDFNIVSQDDECEYTVLGAVQNVPTKSCVFVAGGGSCEIAVYEDGIVESINVPFGVIDVMNEFPDLQEDIASTTLEEVMNYIRSRIGKFESKADILILAGGGHEKFARLSGIHYEKNDLYENPNAPIMMDIEIRKKETLRYFEEISLDEIRKKVDDPKWWYATRAMCAFVLVVAEMIDAKHVVPTNIGMVHGIINKIKL